MCLTAHVVTLIDDEALPAGTEECRSVEYDPQFLGGIRSKLAWTDIVQAAHLIRAAKCIGSDKRQRRLADARIPDVEPASSVLVRSTNNLSHELDRTGLSQDLIELHRSPLLIETHAITSFWLSVTSVPRRRW